MCVLVCVCPAPQQTEASQDFLKSCSADGVSCTAEAEAKTEVEPSGGEDGERADGLPGLTPHATRWCCADDAATLLLSDEDNVERACDTLLMCIVTVLNHGLRNGGGVGDVLRKPSKNVSNVPISKFPHCLRLISVPLSV